MTYKVFVDGQAGTTGLGIFSYLEKRNDIYVMPVDDKRRKDLDYRCEMVEKADATFLCLPESASKELINALDLSSLEKKQKRLIDSSTAFRVDPSWVYGLPEISEEQRKLIRSSFRIAVPGCHATAFILAVRPLVEKGKISHDYPIVASSITGYSGGGKQMITDYQEIFCMPLKTNTGRQGKASATSVSTRLDSPRAYALQLKHKHLPEMQKFAKLQSPPIFVPAVAAYFKGLAVTTYWHLDRFSDVLKISDLQDFYRNFYKNEAFVSIQSSEKELSSNFYDIQAENGSNMVNISVFGNDNQAIIISRLDNLGKGAAGAAIQCLNLCLGLDEGFGL